VTIAALPPGRLRCNTAEALAGDQSAARILSADTAACVADGPSAAARLLAFWLAW